MGCKYEKDGHCLLNECLYGDFLERDDSRFDSGRYCWKPNNVEVSSESRGRKMIDCYKNCKDLRNGVCPPMKTFCPKKLAEHNAKLLDDVSKKFRGRIRLRELTRAETMEIFDDVIAEMKAEVRE